MAKNAWELLAENLNVEGPEDDLSDDELDAATSPQKSFANPFEPNARTSAKVQQPATKMRANTKPQLSPPAPKNDFGQAVSPNQAKNITKQTLATRPGAAQSSATATPVEPAKPLAKPNYDGDRVGQVFRSNGKVVPYRSAWVPKGSDQMRFGKGGEKESKVDLVWTGSEWTTPAEFDALSKAGKLKKQEGLDLTEMFSVK